MVTAIRTTNRLSYVEAARQIVAKESTSGLPRVGSHTREMWIPSNVLIVDDTYQRPYRPAWAKAIAEKFDPDKFRKLQVTPRDDGTYAVVDGQHRLEAVNMMNPETIVEILCDVTIKTGAEIEAKTFSAFNADTRRMSANEKFKAALAAGDPNAAMLKAVVARNGFDIQLSGGKQQDGKFNGVSILQRIAGLGDHKLFAKSSPDLLDQVLKIIRDAWEGSTIGVTRTTEQGIAGFLNRYSEHPNFERKRLVDILRAHSAHKLDRLAGDGAVIFGGDDLTALCRVLLGEYNKRLAEKNRLPEWAKGPL